jgi:hypothetical protein
MWALGFILLLLLAAWCVAHIVNALVGMLSGEKPQDTGRLWLDVFLRLFVVGQLSFAGRMLNYVGIDGWPRRLLYIAGVICILVFLYYTFHG